MPLHLQAIHYESSASEPISLPDGARTFRVGRMEDNDVQINHSSISAKHALLKGSEQNGVEIVDCNSSNGTFVNGVRIDREELRVGDVVKFAFLSYRVVDEEDENSDVSMPTAPVNVLAMGNGAAEKAPTAEKLETPGSSEKLKEPESGLSAREQELESLEAEHKATLRQVKVLQDITAKQEKQIESLRSESRERFKLLSESEDEVEKWKNSFQDLEARNKQISRKFSTTENEKEEIRDALQKEQARFESEHKDLLASRHQLEARFKKEKEVLEEALSATNTAKEQFGENLRVEESKRAARETELATRTRERDELAEQLQKARQDIRERDTEILERDKAIAADQFEREGLVRKLAGAEGSVESLEADCLQWREAYEDLKSSLKETRTELQQSKEREEHLQSRLSYFLDEFRKYLGQLHKDWAFWRSEKSGGDAESLHSIEECFSEGETLRISMRQVLDEVEPIWEKYGNRVREELASQVSELEVEISELDTRRGEKTAEVESLTADVKELREEVDVEVRRAQGLSRRGVQIEIPERFESMVIAQDRECQMLLSLVGTLEFLEQLIIGYRRSKKLREVVYELEEFEKRIVRILEENGVNEFTLEPGTELTLKHRKEVQILGKKGWGTKDYAEQPFHRGVVSKMIRSGYRAGQGEGSVLLRKVEVLIRDTES